MFPSRYVAVFKHAGTRPILEKWEGYAIRNPVCYPIHRFICVSCKLKMHQVHFRWRCYLRHPSPGEQEIGMEGVIIREKWRRVKTEEDETDSKGHRERNGWEDVPISITLWIGFTLCIHVAYMQHGRWRHVWCRQPVQLIQVRQAPTANYTAYLLVGLPESCNKQATALNRARH